MAVIDVIIGERGNDHIRIRVISRIDQVGRDYWDDNWLATIVSVQAGGWKGKNEKAYFRTEELSRFRAKIELLADGKLADAEFEPMEAHLNLKINAEEAGGPISLSGTALDRLENGNTLSFKLTFGRDTLHNLAARLKAVEKAYPTIGKS